MNHVRSDHMTTVFYVVPSRNLQQEGGDEEEWYSQNLQFFLRSEGRFVDARQLVVVQLPVGRTRNAVTTGEAQQKRKRREKKEKSNQWTEKSRNDGTNGADLFPRCLVSSDSVCSLSTLGQLHDFPLPQNAAKTTANTSQNSQTTYKLRNDVNPRSVRLPSAVSWLLLRSLCDETKEKRWTLVINQVNASNRFIHLLIRWRTKLNKRHLIDEPSFVNPSTLSIKYPGRNQLDTHADTCTHSQKRENVTASNKKNSKTTKKHPPFWWFQHNHDHVA